MLKMKKTFLIMVLLSGLAHGYFEQSDGVPGIYTYDGTEYWVLLAELGDTAETGVSLTNVDGIVLNDQHQTVIVGTFTTGELQSESSVFGYNAGFGNDSEDQSAFGFNAGRDNTGGTNQSAFGVSAGRSNTGVVQSAFGHLAGRSNAGNYQSAFGSQAGYYNIGGYQSAFGYLAGFRTTGAYQSALGYHAGLQNTGASQSAFGHLAGQYNDSANNTAVGYGAFNNFSADAGSAVTFDYDDVSVATQQIAILGHGLGADNTYLNLEFTEGDSELPGLGDGDIHVWKIVSVNVLELISDEISARGTGSNHTLTPQYDYTNSTALGYNAEPDASNQVVLGDTNVTEVKTSGSLTTDGFTDGTMTISDGDLTDIDDLTMGSATVNTGVFSMINGAAASDPTFSITVTGEDAYIDQTVGDLYLAAGGVTNIIYFDNPLSTNQTATFGGTYVDYLQDLGDMDIGSATVNGGNFQMTQGEVAFDPSFTITQTDNDVAINQTIGDMDFTAGGDVTMSEGLIIGGNTDYTSYSDKGLATMYGDARIINHITIHAGTFKLHGGDAATTGAVGVFPVLDFSDGSLAEAFATQFVPFRWDSGTDIGVSIDWLCANDATGGDVAWNIAYLAIKDNEEVGAAPTATLTQAFTGAGAGLLQRSEFTTKIVKENITADDIMGIRIFREADGAGDTLGETARFVAIHLHMIRNRLGKPITEEFLLLEDESNFLLEDGTKMILEI